MDNAEQMETRFVDIEIKLAQQEDLVESLNQMVYQQGKRIDQLEAMLHKLGEHVRDGRSRQWRTGERTSAALLNRHRGAERMKTVPHRQARYHR